MDISDLANIPVFVGLEQPEACSKCGARTNFIVLPTGLQVHECLNCQFVWFLEFDDSEAGLDD